MEIVQDVQQRIFEAIKKQLVKEERLATVLQELLFLSADAVYRRIRGDVPLTIYETKKLCDAYNISFDDMEQYKKGHVNFNYIPMDHIGLNFETWLTGIRDGLVQMKNLQNTGLTMSINDTPIFQLFNVPHLTRFKFFFWAKTYLKIPAYADEKFKREKIDKRVLGIGIEAHNIYNSIPSTEIIAPELFRGTLRQIEYYYDAQFFEEPAYALELLDNLSALLHHMKQEAELGRKFALGNEAPTSGNDFNLYANDTYIADNTYIVNSDSGSSVYLSHNIMTYLNTTDPYYIKESEFVLDKLINNSSLISKVNTKDRNKFFAHLEQHVMQTRKRITLDLEESLEA